MFTIYFSPFVAQDPYNFPPSTCQTVHYLNILHEVTYNVDGDFTLQLSVERLQRKQKKFHCKCVFFIITESTFNSLLFFYTHMSIGFLKFKGYSTVQQSATAL